MRSLTFITLAAAGLLLAACGSTSSSSSTNAANTAAPSNANNTNKAIEFAGCMRSHGVPNFPDPSSGGHIHIQVQTGPGGTNVNGVQVNGPAFRSAMTSCRQYLPSGGNPSPAATAARQKAALAFASCMRSHGVPNFPDPEVRGNGVLISGGGLDPNSPVFKSAQNACGPLMQKLFGGGQASAAP